MWLKSFAVNICMVMVVMTTSVVAQKTTEEVFKLASESQKNVLLVFAGSDWCAPCIRFDTKVLSQPQFQAFAQDHIVVMKAEFPQRKTLTKTIQDQNAKLAERYNPKGIFPHILIIRPDGSILSILKYDDQSAPQFITEINQRLSDD